MTIDLKRLDFKGVAAAALLLAALNVPCRAEDAPATPPRQQRHSPRRMTQNPPPAMCRVPRSRPNRQIRPRPTLRASPRRAIAGTMHTAITGTMPIGSLSRSSCRTSITTASSGTASPGSTSDCGLVSGRSDRSRARRIRVSAYRAGRGSSPPACPATTASGAARRPHRAGPDARRRCGNSR